MPLATASRQPSTGPLISLYKLDATNLGAPAPEYWTPGPLNGQSAKFQGVTYTSLPIEVTGFEWTTQGTLPRPKLRLSNISAGLGGYATALVVAYGDLVGATLTRLRTFEMFLDDKPMADPTAYFEPDVFVVNRKAKHTKTDIEFELASIIDQQGRMLPGRQVIRDTCMRTYRSWNGTSFVAGQCPYAGSSYFDANGNSVSSPAQDDCGRRLSDCIDRFGANTPLPTWAFPGATQL